MIKRTALVTLLLGTQSLAIAQSVSYRLIDSDPDKYKRTALSLDLINCDTYIDASAGYGVKLETVIADRILPYVNYRNCWMDAGAHHLYDSYPMAIGGLKKQSNLDIGGSLFLVSRNKKKSVRVVLHSSSAGRYTYTKYIMVPSEVKRMLGVNAGIYTNRKPMRLEDDAHPLYRYKSKDGSVDVPIEDVGSSNYTQPAGDAYMPIVMTHTISLYAGLHIRNVKNTVIQAEGYGRRTNAKVVDFYADVMIAPGAKVSDVKDIAGREWKVVPQAGAINNLGYRVGYSMHSAKSFGLMFYTEAGKRPGPTAGKSFLNNGSYITLGAGVTIASGHAIKLGHGGSNKNAVKKKE